MDDLSTTRRAVIAAGATVSGFVAAGCTDLRGSDDSSGGNETTSDDGNATTSDGATDGAGFEQRLPSVESSAWPQFGVGPANRGHHPSASLPDEAPETAWSTPFQGTFLLTPTVGAGNLYARNDEDGVTAIDVASGEVEWSYEKPDDAMTAPAVGDDAVFVADEGGHVDAVDPDDGSQLWRATPSELNGVRAPVTLHDGLLYVVNHSHTDSGLLGLDPAQDGEVVWSAALNDAAEVPAATDGDTVVGCTADQYVRGFDPDTGDRQWESRVYAEPHIAPILDDGTVYVAAGQDLTAIDATDGSQQWTTDVDELQDHSSSEGFYGPVALGADHVVVHTTVSRGTGWIRGFDRSSGSLEWTVETGNIGDGGLVVSAGTVYAGDRTGSIYAIDAASGDRVWTVETSIDDGAVRATPAVADGRLYVPVSAFEESAIVALE